MNKTEHIKESAYMIVSDMAFLFSINEGMPIVTVINLKNTKTMAHFRAVNNQLLLSSSNLSEANKYKVMLLVERNKEFLLGGLMQWANTQKIK